MTANLVRWNPSGTDGNAVVTSGTPLSQVIIAGAGTVLYDNTAGMGRGSMGVEFYGGAATDQANAVMPTTAAAAGSGQLYGIIDAYPTGGSQEFMTLRTASGNCVRFLCGTSGSITVQNKAGSTVATLGTISTGVPCRYELEAFPNTSTANGTARARIYDDDDALLYDSGALTGSYGGDLATKTVSILRFGDPTTATTSGFRMRVTQPAIDTAATAPTIPPVSKASDGAVTAVAIPITLTAVAPTVEAEGVVSGSGPIGITFTALAPAVTTVRNESVASVPAAVTFTAIAPAVVGSQNASVAAVPIAVTVTARAPGVGGGVGPAAVPISLTALAPTFSSGTSGSVAAVPAAISLTALPPAVAGQQNGTVVAVPAVVVLTARAPVVVGQLAATVAAVPAAVSLVAVPPLVTGGGVVVAVAAAVTLTARVPVVSGSATVPAVAAQLTLTARAPAVSVSTSVSVPQVLLLMLVARAPQVRTVTPPTPISRVWRVRARSRRFIVGRN